MKSVTIENVIIDVIYHGMPFLAPDSKQGEQGNGRTEPPVKRTRRNANESLKTWSHSNLTRPSETFFGLREITGVVSHGTVYGKMLKRKNRVGSQSEQHLIEIDDARGSTFNDGDNVYPVNVISEADDILREFSDDEVFLSSKSRGHSPKGIDKLADRCHCPNVLVIFRAE